MEKLKENKGITLIALVITIIVLLILAGITISALAGDNGLFTRAQQAEKLTKKSQYFEEINIEILDEIAQRKEETKEKAFIKSIQERLENKEWVKEIIATDTDMQEHENDLENTLLTIITKENFKILIDVQNDILNAQIRDSFEKTNTEDKETELTLTANINTENELTSETTITIDATSNGSAIKNLIIQASYEENQNEYVDTIYSEEINKEKTLNRVLTINDISTNIKFNKNYKLYITIKTANQKTKKTTLTDITNYTIKDTEDLKNLSNLVNNGNTFEGKTIYQINNI